MQINVVNHPLLQAKMTILRDKDTKSVTFRHIISEVAALLTFETTRDLPVEEVKVTTPLCETTGCRIKGSVTVVPILRAGLGFMEGVLSVIPEANTAESFFAHVYRHIDRFFDQRPGAILLQVAVALAVIVLLLWADNRFMHRSTKE